MTDNEVSIRALAQRWFTSSDLSSPQVLFDTVWRKVQARHGDKKGMVPLPVETLFLSGAPGAGKGTNTKLIMKERDMTAPPVVVSSLLNS